jgi:serine/threonine-protein kinase RsbT
MNTQRMRILSPTDASLAVLIVQDIAQTAGLGGLKMSALSTAVSELATNVIKYAQHGLLTVQVLERQQHKGIEVIVEDRGPGIADIDLAMQDHVSTGGTLGLGLPGTQRMVDEFDIESTLGVGTRVRIVKWS